MSGQESPTMHDELRIALQQIADYAGSPQNPLSLEAMEWIERRAKQALILAKREFVPMYDIAP